MPIKINGATSGSVTIAAPDTGSDETLNLGTVTNQAAGYVFRETIYYTSNGTFTKASYPWLRAIRVMCQGGGGGGGGAAATGSGLSSCGACGGGGAYAESFITDIASLTASVTVTVGSGGAGGAAGANNGSTGGTSSFGSSVSAPGGGGGQGSSAISSTVFNGGTSGSGGTGQILIAGGNAGYSRSEPGLVERGAAGNSRLSSSLQSFATFFAIDGSVGLAFGGGGLAGGNTQNNATARVGGAGGVGIVIVELYA